MMLSFFFFYVYIHFLLINKIFYQILNVVHKSITVNLMNQKTITLYSLLKYRLGILLEY